MQKSLHTIVTSFIAACGLLAAPALLATPQPPSPPAAPPQAQQTPTVSDQEWRQFAEIYVNAQEIRENYEADITSAGNPEDAQKVQQKMSDEIIAMIEESPMTLERYNELARATASNPDLRNKALEEIEREVSNREG